MERRIIQLDREVSVMEAKLNLTAKAHVKLTKLDNNGNVLSIDEHEVELTREEAEALWHSQQQE